MSVTDVAVKIRNYKCFRDEFAGFDRIKPVNIIIGRNNSGKSSVLDLLEFVTGKETPADTAFRYEDEISEFELQSVFAKGTYSGGLTGADHWMCHGKLMNGLRVCYEITNRKMISYDWLNPDLFNIECDKDSRDIKARIRYMDEHMKKAGVRIPPFFKNKVIRKLSAERDIKQESHDGFQGDGTLCLMNNGDWATRSICAFITEISLNRDVVQRKLLEALNTIFNPDNHFDEITVQHDGSRNYWEIHLSEQGKGLVPLGMSGSGLKTVILVLLNLLVVPEFSKNDNVTQNIADYLFAFEELENNLHPALLRRLFRYIEDFAVEHKCHFFITTHSNVVIDQFSRSPNAQIIHVTHDGEQAYTSTIDSFEEHSGVLDDIGARASDLLQANGIVWLEGPSDRIYFNKWVELYSGGKLKEHRDYECAIYGGALLAHFDAKDPEADCEAVNILRVNRNAILIGDSDRPKSGYELKPRLVKISDAMKKLGGYVWVTDAREIENYIPTDVVRKVYHNPVLPGIGKFERFYYTGNGKSVTVKQKGYWQKNDLRGKFDKVKLAGDVAKHLDKEMLDSRFELGKKMEEICEKIRGWNDIRPT